MEPLITQDEYFNTFDQGVKRMAVATGLTWGLFMFVFMYLVNPLLFGRLESVPFFTWQGLIIHLISYLVLGGVLFGVLFSLAMKRKYHFVIKDSFKKADEMLKKETNQRFACFLPCGYRNAKRNTIGGVLFINSERLLFIGRGKKGRVVEVLKENIENIEVVDGKYGWLTRKLYNPSPLLSIKQHSGTAELVVPQPQEVCAKLRRRVGLN